MDYLNLEEKLILLLKIFKNRPNYLAKYLIYNDALSYDFSTKLSNSDISDKVIEKINNSGNITDLEKLLNNIINTNNISNSNLLSNKLNIQLKKLLESEDYENAEKLKNYMMKKNIKII